MKISRMLKREDFYDICNKTLEKFFEESPSTRGTPLYVYPHLNAIVKMNPSKSVRKYIYTEYSVNSSLPKRLAVWFYTRLCLNTFGLLASKKIKISADITKDTLIYPCNRKFRIFDFEKGTVSVITKNGFSPKSLHNEISFRTNSMPDDFILPIEFFTESTYSERIIDGTPLARITENRADLEKTALEIWRTYSRGTQQTVVASEYAAILKEKADVLIARIATEKIMVNQAALKQTLQYLFNVLKCSDEQIDLTQSHGDFQAGNIWVENKTGKIYIIDWETVDTRSVWYDEAVLLKAIRKTHLFDNYSMGKDLEHLTVVVEEIIYRMNELCELPFDWGTDDFNAFINKLEKNYNV